MKVAPINLAYNPRTLWFDPQGIEIEKGDAVVVETARGIEFGHAASDVVEVSDEEIAALKTPLKPVVRIATDEDVEFAAELEQRGREALPAFKAMVAETGVEMHPVSVEFLLDGDKAVFYFEAEERVDFRDLVRKLASHFHVRIDMRQIGVRDEARIVGGLGHCGQELCCKRMGGEFQPVSIRMAKEQDLSLNPQKISGLCGRLMCCLRYEYDAYKDFKTRAPKVSATVQTPQGAGKVVELDVPREVVTVRVGDEKPVHVPLALFDEPEEEGARPSVIGEAAWREAAEEAATGYSGDALTFVTSQFTGADKLAESGSVRHTGSSGARRDGEAGAGEGSGRKRRSRGSRGGRGGKSQAAQAEAAGNASRADETRKPRRRRSTKIVSGAAETEVVQGEAASEQKAQEAKGAKGAQAEKQAGEVARRSRRSRRGGRKSSGEGAKAGAAKAPRGEGAKSEPKGEAKEPRKEAKRSVRPGQKSSGLANHKPESQERSAEKGRLDAGASPDKEGKGSSSSRRRPRRRRSSSSKQGDTPSQGAPSQGGAE